MILDADSLTQFSFDVFVPVEIEKDSRRVVLVGIAVIPLDKVPESRGAEPL